MVATQLSQPVFASERPLIVVGEIGTVTGLTLISAAAIASSSFSGPCPLSM